MSIYTKNLPYTPYFYIIEHVASGMRYAGCRFTEKKTAFSNNGCHPLELLKAGGYTTSSDKINSIIDKEGLEAFKILEIIEESVMNGLSSLEYETKFLTENNIAQNKNWYNKHNNTNGKVYDQEYVKAIMLDRYGYEYASQCPEFKEKAKQTNQHKRGVDHVSQDPAVKEKN